MYSSVWNIHQPDTDIFRLCTFGGKAKKHEFPERNSEQSAPVFTIYFIVTFFRMCGRYAPDPPVQVMYIKNAIIPESLFPCSSIKIFR